MAEGAKVIIPGFENWFEQEHIDEAIRFAELWLRGEKTNQREKQAIDWIQDKISKNEKTLIFCGYPGVAENLTKSLVAIFNDTTVKPSSQKCLMTKKKTTLQNLD